MYNHRMGRVNTLIFVSGCIVCIDGIDETSVNLWLPIKHSPDQWARKQRTLWEYIKLDSNPLSPKTLIYPEPYWSMKPISPAKT